MKITKKLRFGMDINKNDKLAQKLGSSSPSVVYQALVEIRSKEVNSANGVALLRKRGILKYFVKLLQKPNEKIIDVTLSILGNCCLEAESCLELWRIGAVGPIVRILDGIGKDSIQGRTCRVLANLSQHQEIASLICREGAVPILIEILKPNATNDGKAKEANSCSDMTKEMALRALRLLGENPECRGEIVSQGGVRAAAELILSESTALQKASMKALATLTQYCTDDCALQVQGDGACFQRLVSLVEVPALDDESAIQKSPSSITQSALTCLSNLAHSPEARPLLGNAGAIPAVISHLQYLTSLDLSNEYKLRDLVSTLCLFSRESVNRLKLRDQGGLTQLMIHLKVDKHGPVAAALCNFVFDDNAFRQLIDHGLINVCADRLKGSISVKFKEKRHSHPLRPKSLTRDEGLKRRNSIQVPNSSPAAKGRHRQSSVEDFVQFSLPSNLDIKSAFSPEGCGRKLSKSPLKTAPQKTFRISSPSYQAVRYEQEGHRSISLWSPPANTGDCSGTGCASPECNLSSSSFSAASPWGGVNGSFSLSGFIQSQNALSPTPLPSLIPQFQDGPLSPETSSSCSGGSSSSCTSGYASSPRSDLSDAPSPGYSGTVGVIDEIYSPVYEDVSDDSGQEDCEEKTKEEHPSEKSASNKRSRTCNNGKSEDTGESKQKKICSSMLKDRSSISSFSFEKMQFSLSNDETEDVAISSLVDDDDDEMLTKEEHQGSGGEESKKPKNVKTLVDYLLRLLYHAAQCEEPVTDLASYNTFSALLGFHLIYPDPQSRYGLIAFRILSRIVRNEHYLIPLINQRFVLTVRSWFCQPILHKEEKSNEKFHHVPLRKDIDIKCSECFWLKTSGTSILVDLGKSAESGYGEGELAYGLLKGDDSLRMTIALSLPFIIRSKRIMKKLLFGCNGLISLVGILKDCGNSAVTCDDRHLYAEKCRDENENKNDDEELKIFNAAVDGLSYLAGFIGMEVVVKSHSLYLLKEDQLQPDGIMLGASTSDLICFEKTVGQPSLGHDKVVFALDDGSSIISSREGMSNISPMFRAMLQGSFEESEGTSVKLPGVSLSCLSYIMHYFGECRDSKCPKRRTSSLHSFGKNQNERSSSYSSCPWAERPKEVYGALELVSIADRFLLPNSFCQKLANQVLDFYLCPESAANIYMWCLGTEGISGSKAPEDLGLLEGTVKYILVGCMTLHERVSLIQSIFSRGFGEELVSHINDLFRIYFE